MQKAFILERILGMFAFEHIKNTLILHRKIWILGIELHSYHFLMKTLQNQKQISSSQLRARQGPFLNEINTKAIQKQ